MIQEQTLFSVYPHVVSLSEISNANFDFFANNTNIICDTFKDTINLYMTLRNDVKNYWQLNPSLNSAMGVNCYRFILVCCRNTYFWAYKVIQIVKTKQIRFFDIPICLEGNNNDEIHAITSAIAGFNFVRFVFKSSDYQFFKSFHFLNRDISRLATYDEYYYDISRDNKKYVNNRYLRKQFITQFLSLCDVRVDVGKINVNDAKIIRDEWSIGMSRKNDAVRKSSDKGFWKFVSYPFDDNHDVKCISIYYKQRIISMQVFLLNKNCHVCECLYVIHIWDDKGDNVLKTILNKMKSIHKYLAWLQLKDFTEKVWYGPAENAHLRRHKEMCCDGKIEYYIL